ncbi:MerR family transcriptional regulator [Brachybacterium halotolerans subsp. kimchii]|uniref:MerR family transcriptional regulator n=1 Tax=Brachybacterium halotolerans TaxID=2795215 RepID=UPI001E4814E5|nr:MerR family transcriptional regulator [Brachybacterium halotolerans]UEJ81524.1 MerR family transcriptional regulator [Brachybacterium halotolerans subsp. kimchii]
MPWSTRQLADLAGTTVNTVRHYHQAGLLPEPERRSNGYKQYTVPHLVRLLRIRRLVDLGVPLARIDSIDDPAQDAGGTSGDGEVGDDGESSVSTTLRELDEELQSRISQLEEARTQIAALLAGGAPAHTPPGFESVSAGMSEADRSLIQIYAELYRPEALADVRSMVEASDETSRRFDELPSDADEASRQRLAEDLLPRLQAQVEAHPWLRDPAPQYQKSRSETRNALRDALHEIYNDAQLDVIARVERLAVDQTP